MYFVKDWSPAFCKIYLTFTYKVLYPHISTNTIASTITGKPTNKTKQKQTNSSKDFEISTDIILLEKRISLF